MQPAGITSGSEVLFVITQVVPPTAHKGSIKMKTNSPNALNRRPLTQPPATGEGADKKSKVRSFDYDSYVEELAAGSKGEDTAGSKLKLPYDVRRHAFEQSAKRIREAELSGKKLQPGPYSDVPAANIPRGVPGGKLEICDDFGNFTCDDGFCPAPEAHRPAKE